MQYCHNRTTPVYAGIWNQLRTVKGALVCTSMSQLGSLRFSPKDNRIPSALSMKTADRIIFSISSRFNEGWRNRTVRLLHRQLDGTSPVFPWSLCCWGSELGFALSL